MVHLDIPLAYLICLNLYGKILAQHGFSLWLIIVRTTVSYYNFACPIICQFLHLYLLLISWLYFMPPYILSHRLPVPFFFSISKMADSSKQSRRACTNFVTYQICFYLLCCRGGGSSSLSTFDNFLKDADWLRFSSSLDLYTGDHIHWIIDSLVYYAYFALYIYCVYVFTICPSHHSLL